MGLPTIKPHKRNIALLYSPLDIKATPLHSMALYITRRCRRIRN